MAHALAEVLARVHSDNAELNDMKFTAKADEDID